MYEINVLDGQDKIIPFGTRFSIILDQFTLGNPPYAIPSHLFSIKGASDIEYKFTVKVYYEDPMYKLRINFLGDYDDELLKDLQFFFILCDKLGDQIDFRSPLNTVTPNISMELMSDAYFKSLIFARGTPLLLVLYILEHSPGSQNPAVLSTIEKHSNLLSNPSHGPNKCQLSTDLSNLYEKGDLSDFNIVTKNKTFNVHRCVLASRSTVFEKYFERSQNGQTNMTLDVNSDVVEQMLRFIYTNSVSKLDELVDDLFNVAKKYELRGLREMCVSHMAKGVTVDNAMNLLHFAKKHDEKLLLNKVTEFFVQNTEQILVSKNTDDFLKPLLDLELSLDSSKCLD